jgi:hypothetical protein
MDPTAGTCAIVEIQQGTGACNPLALISGGWCIRRASLSNTATCDGGTAVQATAATGTFSVAAGSPPVVTLDVQIEFPATTIRVQATGCAADCSENDCRS